MDTNAHFAEYRLRLVLKTSNKYRTQPSNLSPRLQRLLPPLSAPCDRFKETVSNVLLLAEVRDSRA